MNRRRIRGVTPPRILSSRAREISMVRLGRGGPIAVEPLQQGSVVLPPVLLRRLLREIEPLEQGPVVLPPVLLRRVLGGIVPVQHWIAPVQHEIAPVQLAPVVRRVKRREVLRGGRAPIPPQPIPRRLAPIPPPTEAKPNPNSFQQGWAEVSEESHWIKESIPKGGGKRLRARLRAARVGRLSYKTTWKSNRGSGSHRLRGFLLMLEGLMRNPRVRWIQLFSEKDKHIGMINSYNFGLGLVGALNAERMILDDVGIRMSEERYAEVLQGNGADYEEMELRLPARLDMIVVDWFGVLPETGGGRHKTLVGVGDFAVADPKSTDNNCLIAAIFYLLNRGRSFKNVGREIVKLRSSLNLPNDWSVNSEMKPQNRELGLVCDFDKLSKYLGAPILQVREGREVYNDRSHNIVWRYRCIEYDYNNEDMYRILDDMTGDQIEQYEWKVYYSIKDKHFYPISGRRYEESIDGSRIRPGEVMRKPEMSREELLLMRAREKMAFQRSPEEKAILVEFKAKMEASEERLAHLKQQAKLKIITLEEKKELKKLMGKPDPEYIWQFDVETVVCSNDHLRVYHMSLMIVDIETYEVICIKHFSGMDSMKQFLCFMRRPENGKYSNAILCGYNSSKFDNYPLVRELILANEVEKVRISMGGSAILKVNYKGFGTFDLCKFTACSLNKAARDYKVNVKKNEIDHKLIQKIYSRMSDEEKENFPHNLSQELQDKIQEYNHQDNVVALEVLKVYRKSVRDVCNIDCLEYLTQNSMSFKIWGKTTYGYDRSLTAKLEKECATRIDEGDYSGACEIGETIALRARPCETKEFFEFCVGAREGLDRSNRKAQLGGRSQMFDTGVFHSKNGFVSYDAKGLYPFVMSVCEFPLGSPENTPREVVGKLGMYRVTIHSQSSEYHNIIPKRVSSLPLDWTFKGEMETNLTSEDIRILRKYGASITVHEGYYWDRSSKDVFGEYFEKLTSIKTQHDLWRDSKDPEDRKKYSPGIRQFCKMMMNSLSGKLMQRMFTVDKEICHSYLDEDAFFRTHRNCTHTIMGNASFMTGAQTGELDYTKSYPIHLGCFVYAYARGHMFEAVLSKVPSIIATDTDSAHLNLDKQDVQDLLNSAKRPVEDAKYAEYGVFSSDERGLPGSFADELLEARKEARDERIITTEYAIAAKNYCFTYEDNKVLKMRFKGIGESNSLVLEDEIPDTRSFARLVSDAMYTTAEELQIFNQRYFNLHVADRVRIRANGDWLKKDNERAPDTELEQYITKYALRLDTFRRLANGKTVEIYCNPIQKDSYDIGLKCKTIIKKIIGVTRKCKMDTAYVENLRNSPLVRKFRSLLQGIKVRKPSLARKSTLR